MSFHVEMDPVACAVCTMRQGVPRSANIFVCYACHSANFLERNAEGVLAFNSSPAPAPSGKHVVVTKITDTFYKVEKEATPDPSQANQIGSASSLHQVPLSDEIMDPSLLSPKTDKKGLVGDSSCTVCMDGPADTVLQPCSHGGICYACADALVRRALLNGGALCPHCRAPITSLIKLGDMNDQVSRGEEVQLPRAYRLTRKPPNNR